MVFNPGNRFSGIVWRASPHGCGEGSTIKSSGNRENGIPSKLGMSDYKALKKVVGFNGKGKVKKIRPTWNAGVNLEEMGQGPE